MTVKIIHGNLITAFEKGHINFMAHCCNMQNVMGAGIAKQIKQSYPFAYTTDCAWYRSNENKREFSHISVARIEINRYVINVYGQRYYGTKTKQLDEEYLRIGLTQLAAITDYADVIGLPYNMGCGLAGGNWNDVYKIIEEVFVNHQVKIYKL